MMKAAANLCFVATLAVAAALPVFPGPGGAGPTGSFMPSPAMIQSFIPTPEEINALAAIPPPPAPGAYGAFGAPGGFGAFGGPGAAFGPMAPPTLPPAVAHLIKKYQTAAAAFMPPAPAPAPGAA
ncbi:protein tfg-1-like [Penaeus japonicus]|uniref:protein tfg-1-like n=1 Tax=Penaeus japonicus TaxID=27405 RepID=UPI001C70DC89|nr:protein tfg-1-like [Penaeus japonicus]